MCIALRTAARGHSTDMKTRGFFDHTSPPLDGAPEMEPWDRAEKAGYPVRGIGENIAAGYETPEKVVQGWMTSPGHRRNILDCDFQEIGVGVELGPDGGPWWTQMFGVQ